MKDQRQEWLKTPRTLYDLTNQEGKIIHKRMMSDEELETARAELAAVDPHSNWVVATSRDSL